MTKIVSFINQKGGVGKTTLCVQAAFYLAEQQKNVLLIDFDAQGNATSTMIGRSIDENATLANRLYDTDLNEIQTQPFYSRNESTNNLVQYIDVIPTPENDNALIDKQQLPLEACLNIRANLGLLSRTYDYILFDCPPALGNNVLAALASSTHIIVPVNPDSYSANGLSALIQSFMSIKDNINENLEFAGVVINELDTKSTELQKFAAEIRNSIPELVLENCIHIRQPLVTAAREGLPISKLRYAHVAAKEIAAVMKEIFETRVN